MLCEKTSLIVPASHAEHFLILFVLDSTPRSEAELENANSVKKLRYPRTPMGCNPRWRRRQTIAPSDTNVDRGRPTQTVLRDCWRRNSSGTNAPQSVQNHWLSANPSRDDRNPRRVLSRSGCGSAATMPADSAAEPGYSCCHSL